MDVIWLLADKMMSKKRRSLTLDYTELSNTVEHKTTYATHWAVFSLKYYFVRNLLARNLFKRNLFEGNL